MSTALSRTWRVPGIILIWICSMLHASLETGQNSRINRWQLETIAWSRLQITLPENLELEVRCQVSWANSCVLRLSLSKVTKKSTNISQRMSSCLSCANTTQAWRALDLMKPTSTWLIISKRMVWTHLKVAFSWVKRSELKSERKCKWLLLWESLQIKCLPKSVQS